MKKSLPRKLRIGIEQLELEGLNFVAILGLGRLPEQVVNSLPQSAFPVSGQARIILIGSGGRALWDAIPDLQWQQVNPIDHYSVEAARRFARQVLPENRYHVLYPGDTPVALQQLGAAAGWHTPSPLGIGINPRWGLWYAYRAALLTDAPLAETIQPAPPPPCASCKEQPCIAACPAGALNAAAPIDMNRCAGYRLATESDCADRCLARMSCPVAAEQRYTLEQVQYHYRLSLETLRDYF